MRKTQLLTLAAFGLSIFLLAAGNLHAQENYVEQGTTRSFLVFWQDGQVSGSGRHRPYAELKVFSAQDVLLWSGQADGRGAFSFLLPSETLDRTAENILTLRAFDSFDREILNEEDNPDRLTAILPSALATSETPTADSEGIQQGEKVSQNTSQNFHESAPETSNSTSSSFLQIFMSIVLIGGLGIGVYFFFQKRNNSL